MKIVRIFGGLGNQMFQYALAVALREMHPDEQVWIDASCMKGYPLHNGYELQRIFGTSIAQAPQAQVARVAWPLPHYRLWQLGSRVLPRRRSMVVEGRDMAFMPDLTGRSDDLLLEGYWQTERYFRTAAGAVRRAFRFPDFEPGSRNAALAARLGGCTSLSVHVRRGDYLKIANTSGICTMDYYKQAMDAMLARVQPELVVVFSDDARWCRENFGELLGGLPAEYVDWNGGNDSYRDMQLMSLCSHNIIANSSFSWWGAWLNQNPGKVVMAPSRWMNGPGWPDIIPKEWKKIMV